nr:ClassA_beta_lactamase [uncultured bacterium]
MIEQTPEAIFIGATFKKEISMRSTVALIVIVVVTGAAVLACSGFSARNRGSNVETKSSTTPSSTGLSQNNSATDEKLAERLRSMIEAAGGDVGLTVIHVESGRTVSIHGDIQLPLYSVFKLPLAVAVLKDVEEKRLQLDHKVVTSPTEIVPGSQENTDLWRKPIERTVAELLELSISRSDNTSADKLLKLVGGPEAVTNRMRSLGFPNFMIHSSVSEYVKDRSKVNTGTASELGRLLVELQQGHVLQKPQLSVLLGFMERATTGNHRLRGLLPAGTLVADKTGTGEAGVATNDVGLITLPNGGGHLAIAVLIKASKLAPTEQEKLIAELARVSYEAHLSTGESATQ